MNTLLSVLSAVDFQHMARVGLYAFLISLGINSLLFIPVFIDIFRAHAMDKKLESRGNETMGEVTGTVLNGVYTTKSGVSPVMIGDGKSAGDFSLATRLLAPGTFWAFKKNHDGIYIDYYVGNEKFQMMVSKEFEVNVGDQVPVLYLPEKPQVAKMEYDSDKKFSRGVLKILAIYLTVTLIMALVMVIF